MLSLFECITHSSSMSLEEITLSALVNWIFHAFNWGILWLIGFYFCHHYFHVQYDCSTSYFMKTPYIDTLQILLIPPFVATKLHPHCFFFVLFLWPNRWLHHIRCAIFLNDVINPHMSVKLWYLSTRRTLMCVLCNKASRLLRSDTRDFLLILWFDIKHTHRDTQHTQGPVDWHTHINTYLHHLLYAHSIRCYKTRFLVWNTNNTYRDNVNK